MNPSLSLLLYSDQIIPANARIDARLLEILRSRGPRIGYVGSGPEPDRRFFEERRAYYAGLDLQLDVFVDPASALEHEVRSSLFGCDAIHLAGGDTAAFLHWLREAELIQALRDWAQAGGTLIGTSAGAILMTPSIALNALYEGNDPETVGAPEALDLLPFEVFPHWEDRPDYESALLSHSRRTAHPIAAIPDGDGIVVSRGRVNCIGPILWFQRGTRVDCPLEGT